MKLCIFNQVVGHAFNCWWEIFNYKTVRNFHSRYFTWYPKYPTPEKEDEEIKLRECHLVGFNLQQACFNLENVCVLLGECSKFDTTCKDCQVRYWHKIPISKYSNFSLLTLPLESNFRPWYLQHNSVVQTSNKLIS